MGVSYAVVCDEALSATGGASVSLWSRGMESCFSGRDGGVRTTMFGADYAKGPLEAERKFHDAMLNIYRRTKADAGR